ncbi:hypothetical protein EZS27_038682 [termite gut metagenome]|uniref:Uncharacterized protein n=1 Tax=termite gut metagenome TaxID=433724 RepID=A0A5J4PM86_9ZZZZ
MCQYNRKSDKILSKQIHFYCNLQQKELKTVKPSKRPSSGQCGSNPINNRPRRSMPVLTSIFAVLEGCFAVRGRLPLVLRTVSVVLRTAKHPSRTVNYRPKDERCRPKDGKIPFKVQFVRTFLSPAVAPLGWG